MMNNHNTMQVVLMKAEVSIKLNFDISCQEFYAFIKKTENADLEKAGIK